MAKAERKPDFVRHTPENMQTLTPRADRFVNHPGFECMVRTRADHVTYWSQSPTSEKHIAIVGNRTAITTAEEILQEQGFVHGGGFFYAMRGALFGPEFGIPSAKQ